MLSKRMTKSIFIGIFAIALAALVLAVTVTPAAAVFNTKDYCESFGGTWTGSVFNEDGALCANINHPFSVKIWCGPGYSEYTIQYHAPFTWTLVKCGHYDIPLKYGMERKGVCKLMDVEDAYLGGMITAIIKGKPSVLKLKADGKTYVLPVVPGSVVANGDGTYTAQFYTLDPVTGQALVPAGDYTARCHGTNGSNDGGSANTVSISY